jgi:transcription termination/antitermination protein NusA
MKGMRVQSIIRELRGEKIDIIEYSEDPVQFATHALSPAKISRVSIISLPDKHMEVIVDDTQLSLAIGKKGQNVRLAAKLLGWKVDIKSEEEKRQEVESQMAALVSPGAPVSILLDYGLADHLVEKLVAGGISTVEQLGDMTPEQLEGMQGIDGEQVESIRDAVVAWYAQFDEQGEAGTGPVAQGAPAWQEEVYMPEDEEEAAAAPSSGADSERPAFVPDEAGEGGSTASDEQEIMLESEPADEGDSAKLKDADQAG